MDYIKKTYTDKAVEVQISSFAGKGGVTEYHVLLAITDRTLPFSGQLQNIQWAYVAVIQEVLPDDATAVFRRYFLSDAANQADLVMVWECENSYCPLSIVEQAPLNGSKIAMWTWFQTGITVETTKNGMSKAKHNRYTQYWTGGSCNRASNSEYQTRLLLNDYVLQLTEQGCKLANDCIRTWFFVQNVDVNYAGVVKARKEVFITQDLTEKTHYISSTGIEGRHADPNVFVQMDTYAVKGLQSGQIQFLYAPTHLNPTYEYGVTFERGDSCNLWRPETNLHFRNREYRQSRRDHVSGGYPETDGTHAGKHRHLATGGGKRIARHHAGNRLLARPGRLCRGQAIYRKPVSVVSPPDRTCSRMSSGLADRNGMHSCHTGGCTSICILIIIYYTNDKKYGKHEERKIQGNKQDE